MSELRCGGESTKAMHEFLANEFEQSAAGVVRQSSGRQTFTSDRIVSARPAFMSWVLRNKGQKPGAPWFERSR